MNGKILGIVIVASALIAGAAIYYLQVYAYYVPIKASAPEATMRLVSIASGEPEPIVADGFEGIDADSSPLRFRGCFTTVTSLATLSETYQLYPDPTPLIAPSWFTCFDAGQIGADLEAGLALAFLSETGIHTGVDRVIAVYPDGRAFAWQQLNGSTE